MGRLLRRLPVVLAASTVLLQVAYPLVHGHPRDVLTVLTVCLFFLASALHAATTRGAGWALAFVLVTTTTGLVAEAVGVATGVPFGDYRYSHTLGWQVLDVPVVIPLAWAMFAYPSYVVGQRLGRGRVTSALVGAIALASWDLFLDPQMVAAGHWRWLHIRVTVPGVAHVPLSNFLGWALVAIFLLCLLQVLPRRVVDDRVPAALFSWTYLSSVLANLAFFGRPGVALVGGVGMGVVALPHLRSTGSP